MNPHDPVFLIGLLIVAVTYSSVGHGGASGYLALMAFTVLPARDASTIALTLNVGVSLIAFALFQRAKHFDWSLTWPFLLGSVPFAFLGGSLKIADKTHNLILAIVLLYAAVVLVVKAPHESDDRKELSRPICVMTGAFIGLLSGIVGVGGGIFLSPILILKGWANAKQTASVSALFILVNSCAGLAARPTSETGVVLPHLDLVAVSCLGAGIGAWIGAFRTPSPTLRRILSVVLLVAVFKLVTKG